MKFILDKKEKNSREKDKKLNTMDRFVPIYLFRDGFYNPIFCNFIYLCYKKLKNCKQKKKQLTVLGFLICFTQIEFSLYTKKNYFILKIPTL